MVVYERSVLLEAPLDAVWAFHSSPDGFVAVTPDWIDVEVSVAGPPGMADAGELAVGMELSITLCAFGIVPLGSWVTRITAREYQADAAWFRDEFVTGPFRYCIHTHHFTSVDGRTELRDRVEYEFPLRRVSRVANLVLAVLFRYRHRRTKAILETV